MTDTVRPEVGKRYRTRDGQIATVIAVKLYAYGNFGPRNGYVTTHRWDAQTGASATSDHPLDLIECIGELK